MKTEPTFDEVLGQLADLIRTCEGLIMLSSPSLGKFESDCAAMSLIRLCASNAWGVHDLGVTSVDRYPAATACARSAFEMGAVAAWLLFPEDPFEREGRWLGWFKSNERFYTNLSNDLHSTSEEIAASLKRTALHHSRWRTAIEAKLPRGKVVEKPSMPKILKELGFLNLYMTYRVLSQVLHAEPDALRLVHKAEYIPKDGSTTDEIFEQSGQEHFWGCFSDESDWDIPIRMATWGLMVSLPALLSRIEAFSSDADSLFEKQGALHQALDRLTKHAPGRGNKSRV